MHDNVSLSDNSSADDFAPDNDNFGQPVPDLPAGVDADYSDDSDDDQNPDNDSHHDDDDDSHHNDDESDDDSNSTDCDESNSFHEDEVIHGDDNDNDDDVYDSQQPAPEINIPDEVVSSPPASPPQSPRQNTGVGHENTGVGAENTGVGEQEPTGQELSQSMDSQYGARTHDINLHDHKPCSYSHHYGPEHLLVMFEQPMGEAFMTEQMPLKKGLKYFGKSRADAVVAEMRQLDNLNVIKPVSMKSLTHEQKQHALSYLMYLKQKRCGRIKARGCADGQKQ